MISFLSIPVLSGKPVIKTVWLLVFAHLLLIFISLYEYLNFLSMNFILGICSLCLCLQCSEGKASTRYGWITVPFIVLCYLLPVSTLLYISISVALLFLVESFFGKKSILALLSVGFMSPIFEYGMNTLSFPLRLKLTEWAGKLLGILDSSTAVHGNLISRQGNEFSVDPACMGLRMMEAAFLLGVMLLCTFQQKLNRRLKWYSLLLYFITLALLNLVANLIRIVMLVYFNILPDSPWHEVIGISCLLVYVFLPAIWLSKKLTQLSPVLSSAMPGIQKITIPKKFIHCLLLLTMVGLVIRVYSADTYRQPPVAEVNGKGGFTVKQYEPGILQLNAPSALVYIKYLRGFYDSDHNPLLCWTGSGYQVQRISEERFSTGTIYTGELSKGDGRLYTAWWFGNGQRISADPFSWRWDMIKGAPAYSVINVACSTRAELNHQLAQIIDHNILTTYLN